MTDLGVGALERALESSLRARSYSLFSDSSFTAASQISSELGLAWNAIERMDRAAGTSFCREVTGHRSEVSPQSDAPQGTQAPHGNR